MTLEEYVINPGKNTEEKVANFISLSILDRKDYLMSLPDKEFAKFITTLRNHAREGAWTHERDLIEEGWCAREWTPDQIESIMNIDEENGMKKDEAGKAKDINSKTYYAHHMLNVKEYPEYAGDWKNIQFLSRYEHYGEKDPNTDEYSTHGAHYDHKTYLTTKGYYDPETDTTIEFELTAGKDFFAEMEKLPGDQQHPPKAECIFKSTEEIKNNFNVDANANDGEILALKNLDYSMSDDGKLDDFERSLSLAEKYKADNILSKYGILSDIELAVKYNFTSGLFKEDMNILRAFEYIKCNGVSVTNYSKYELLNDSDLSSKYSGLTGDALRIYDFACKCISNSNFPHPNNL